jgi:V8-like Glu-specific endopeptidase
MMQRVWLVAPVLALAFGCAPGDAPTTSDESIEDSSQHREPIVGGSTTTAFPAVGAIIYQGDTWCTGTVVAPRTVITAAHCVKGFSASQMKFVIGAKVSAPTATLNVASAKFHPSYNESQLTNDIAVLTLASDAPVTPMKIVADLDASYAGDELVFVGFGASNGVQQTGYGTKRFVNMVIENISATQFEYSTPGKNTCNGDSGGPAFLQHNGDLYLAGVTSYGDQNCTQYGVDTRVDAYTSFTGVAGTTPGGGTGGGGTGGGGPTDPCQGETFNGRCNGDTVIWCENQQVKQQNCASQSKVCGFSAQNNYFACIAAAQQDPCNGETYEGRCDGKKLIWCENQQVKNQNCTKGCAFKPSAGYFDCK